MHPDAKWHAFVDELLRGSIIDATGERSICRNCALKAGEKGDKTTRCLWRTTAEEENWIGIEDVEGCEERSGGEQTRGREKKAREGAAAERVVERFKELDISSR